jgi:hypothetical protein
MRLGLTVLDDFYSGGSINSEIKARLYVVEAERVRQPAVGPSAALALMCQQFMINKAKPTLFTLGPDLHLIIGCDNRYVY